MLLRASFLIAVVFLCYAQSVRGTIVEVSQDGRPVIPLPQQCRYFKTLLALDGGGMRGIISTQILLTLIDQIKDHLLVNQELLSGVNSSFRYVTKNDFHVDLADYFDAVAGISAGSWIATYVASKGGSSKQSAQIMAQPHIRRRYGYIRPGSIEGLQVFFMEYGVYIYPPQIVPAIFRPRFWGAPVLLMDYLTVPAYRPQGLEWTLNQFLGDTKLSQVDTSLLIAAFDLNIRSAVQFTLDKIEEIPARARLAAIEGATKELQKCIDRLNRIIEKPKGKGQLLGQMKRRCRPKLDISDPLEGKKKFTLERLRQEVKPMVRTGHVKTRAIPRDFKEEKDFRLPAMEYTSGMDYYISDLARASSAFPMLHGAKNIKPMFDVADEFDLIDGAMVGNNPTLQAVVWMSSKPNINLTDIAIFSIGTGSSMQQLEGIADGGFAQWSTPIVSLLLDSSSEFLQSNIDFLFYETMKFLVMPNQYLRIQVKAESNTPQGRALASVDDVTLLDLMRDMGLQTALRYKSNIRGFIKDFMFAACSYARYNLLDQRRRQLKAADHAKVAQLYSETLERAEEKVHPKS